MRNSLLRRYARWLYRHPWWVVVVAIALTVFSLFVSIRYLKTQTGILDLYSEKNPVSQRFLDYTKKFGAAEYLIIVFEGPDQATRRVAMDALASRLKADPHHYIQDIFYRIDLDLFKKHAFQFLTEPEARKMLEQARNPDGGIRALFQAKGWADFLSFINNSLENGLKKATAPQGDPAKDFDKLLQPLLVFRDFLEGKVDPNEIGSRLETASEEKSTVDDKGYLRTEDKQMHVMMLRPVDPKQDYKLAQKLVEWTREQIAPMKTAFPDVTIGVTGGPALNNDQFKISRKDMTLASIFAYASTAALFILAFKSFARPFLGLLTLNLAMTWVFGFTTVAIGHLNMFSLAFLVILVGQGTYFGVHVVARYDEELHHGRDVATAIEETLAHTFGNIFTSALTTAAAFYATTLVDLKGFAELGWIAGTGVLLSALSMELVLPAFLVLYDRRRPIQALRGMAATADTPLPTWTLRYRTLLQHRAPWIVGAVLIVAGWGAYMFYSPKHGIEFDNNLLNLQAKDTEAVRYEKKLIETSLSPRAGIFLTNSLDQARDIATRAKQLSTVQRAEWLGAVFPEGSMSETTRRELSESITQLAGAVLQAPNVESLLQELLRLKRNLEAVENRALNYSQGSKILASAEQGIQAIDESLQKISEAGLDHSGKKIVESPSLISLLGDFQNRFFDSLRGVLRDAAAAPLLRLEDLPKELRDRFVAQDGSYAVYAFPKVNIWDRSPLENFVAELRSLSPEVTGPPIMFLEILRMVQKDYFKAALFSAIAIFLIFCVDFRSLRYAVLAALPLALGVLSLFGLMSWLHLPFNTANMIALPMILGIGAGNGVHMIHRFREEGADNIDFLFKSTGKALLITYLDSTTSFIGLAFANHQGLAQLGKVVILGLTTCTAAGILFLPAVMEMLIRAKQKKIRQR